MEGLNILLVDRDPDLLNFNKTSLIERSIGEVKAITSFSEALSIIEHESIDLLITGHKADEQDASHNGDTLVRALKKKNSHALAVLATGKPDLKPFDELHRGFDAVLLKPYTERELDNVLEVLALKYMSVSTLSKGPNEKEIETVFTYLAADSLLSGNPPSEVRLEILKLLKTRYPSLKAEEAIKVENQIFISSLETALRNALDYLQMR